MQISGFWCLFVSLALSGSCGVGLLPWGDFGSDGGCRVFRPAGCRSALEDWVFLGKFLARTANKTPFGRAPAATEIILARLSGAVCSESQVFSQFLAVAYAGLADGAAGPRDLRSWFVANRSFSAAGSGALLRKTQFSSAERHRPAARGSDGSAWAAPGRAWVGENSDLQNRRPHRCRWAPQSGVCIALRGGRKAELSLPVVHSRGGKLNNCDLWSPSSERSEHRRRTPKANLFADDCSGMACIEVVLPVVDAMLAVQSLGGWISNSAADREAVNLVWHRS